MTEKQYHSVPEVAHRYGVTSETVRAWIRAGKLPAVRLPGSREYRIYAADLILVIAPGAPPINGERRR